MSLDADLLNDFFDESKNLIEELVELLEDIESDFSQVSKLNDFGNKIDRIMGTARSLAMMAEPDHGLNLISDYTSLCKLVAYKGAENTDNPLFYDVTVALLLDATEALKILIPQIELKVNQLKRLISPQFIDRVKWISEMLGKPTQYLKTSDSPKEVGVSSGANALGQSEIDDLLKKLGF